jgi:hypothetical protein
MIAPSTVGARELTFTARRLCDRDERENSSAAMTVEQQHAVKSFSIRIGKARTRTPVA